MFIYLSWSTWVELLRNDLELLLSDEAVALLNT